MISVSHTAKMDRRGRFFEGNKITKEFGLGNVRYARGRSNPGVLK